MENRAGGGTVIGTEIVAKSPPDGHNLLMVSTSHTTNPTLVRKLPFDTLRDLAPVDPRGVLRPTCCSPTRRCRRGR